MKVIKVGLMIVVTLVIVVAAALFIAGFDT